jgi:hypothetical protein
MSISSIQHVVVSQGDTLPEVEVRTSAEWPALTIRTGTMPHASFSITLTGDEEQRVRFARELARAAAEIADWQPPRLLVEHVTRQPLADADYGLDPNGQPYRSALHADCGTRHRIGDCPLKPATPA